AGRRQLEKRINHRGTEAQRRQQSSSQDRRPGQPLSSELSFCLLCASVPLWLISSLHLTHIRHRLRTARVPGRTRTGRPADEKRVRPYRSASARRRVMGRKWWAAGLVGGVVAAAAGRAGDRDGTAGYQRVDPYVLQLQGKDEPKAKETPKAKEAPPPKK